MKQKKVIGIDLGATNVRGSVVTADGIEKIFSARIRSSGTMDEVLEDVYALTNSIMEDGIAGSGIGVPRPTLNERADLSIRESRLRGSSS